MTLLGTVLRQTLRWRAGSALASQIQAVRVPRGAVSYEHSSRALRSSLATTVDPAQARDETSNSPVQLSEKSSLEVDRIVENPPERVSQLSQNYSKQEDDDIFAQIPEIAQDDVFDEEKKIDLHKLTQEVEVFRKLKELDLISDDWENKPQIIEKLLKLNWIDDCQPRIQLLKNTLKMKRPEVIRILKKNPLILCEDFEDLKKRLKYLYEDNEGESHGLCRFPSDACKIVFEEAFWLTVPVERLLIRESFFKNQFQLSRHELLRVVLEDPRIMTSNLRNLALIRHFLIEEMGFSLDQIKIWLISTPRIFRKDASSIASQCKIFRDHLGATSEDIATYPKALLLGEFRLKQRVKFLRHINRAQFTKGRPGYISFRDISVLKEEIFAQRVAKSTSFEYKKFIDHY